MTLEQQQRLFVRTEIRRAGYSDKVSEKLSQATSVAEVLMILSGVIGENVGYGTRFNIGNNFVLTIYRGSSVPDICQN